MRVFAIQPASRLDERRFTGNHHFGRTRLGPGKKEGLALDRDRPPRAKAVREACASARCLRPAAGSRASEGAGPLDDARAATTTPAFPVWQGRCRRRPGGRQAHPCATRLADRGRVRRATPLRKPRTGSEGPRLASSRNRTRNASGEANTAVRARLSWSPPVSRPRPVPRLRSMRSTGRAWRRSRPRQAGGPGAARPIPAARASAGAPGGARRAGLRRAAPRAPSSLTRRPARASMSPHAARSRAAGLGGFVEQHSLAAHRSRRFQGAMPERRGSPSARPAARPPAGRAGTPRAGPSAGRGTAGSRRPRVVGAGRLVPFKSLQSRAQERRAARRAPGPRLEAFDSRCSGLAGVPPRHARGGG